MRLIRTAVQTTGTVIEMRPSRDRKTKTITYAPTFSFRDEAGVDHIISVQHFTTPPEHRVGDRVPVLYHAANPKDARIDQFTYHWWVPIFAAIIGAIYLAIGLRRLLRSVES